MIVQTPSFLLLRLSEMEFGMESGVRCVASQPVRLAFGNPTTVSRLLNSRLFLFTGKNKKNRVPSTLATSKIENNGSRKIWPDSGVHPILG